MQLFVNRESLVAESGETVAQVLARLHIPAGKGLAVAVNEEVVPRKLWDEKKLVENDALTLIRPTQGG
ncbi:MAG: sulfur carrier protein ThiS [Spirochaetia bacterium]|nr:sulfur carrier protein ThiS [Spirochaetia bacterium]